eukprot:g3188.t1
MIRLLARQRQSKMLALRASTDLVVSRNTPSQQLQARGFCDIKSKHEVVSPDIFIYSFPITAITSVTNRVCGGAVWVGLSGVGLYSVAGGDVGAFVEAVKASSLVVPAKFLVSFPLLYHYFYAIRHVVWERMPESLSTSSATSFTEVDCKSFDTASNMGLTSSVSSTAPASSFMMEKSYAKWKTFDVDAALAKLENEDKPDEPNLRLEKTTDGKTGKSAVHIDCVDYKKTKEEVRLDEDIKVGVGQLRHTVLASADSAAKMKDEGNRHYKKGKYTLAKARYAEGIAKMKTAEMALPIMSGRLSHRIKQILIDLHNNFAMSAVKLAEYENAVTTTSNVLEKWDEKNEKALYRRGISHARLGSIAKARADFQNLVNINPENAAARKALQDLGAS